MIAEPPPFVSAALKNHPDKLRHWSALAHRLLEAGAPDHDAWCCALTAVLARDYMAPPEPQWSWTVPA